MVMTDLSRGAGRDRASLWTLSEDTCCSATKSLYNPGMFYNDYLYMDSDESAY